MIPLAIPIILTLGLRLTNQQAPSTELSFCLNKSTTSNTLQTFWQDAGSSDCEFDALRLIDLYTQLTHGEVITGDRCTLLFIHQMRKKLINVASRQLEEAFIMQTLKENREVNRLLELIHTQDSHILEAVWTGALNEIFLFIEQADIVEGILQIHSDEQKALALQLLLSKTKLSGIGNKNMMPLITYTFDKIIKSENLTTASIDRLRTLYNRLPKELSDLYDSSEFSVFLLLNRAHWEYLYAPRDNGPDSDRRLPLTWSKEKNYTDIDGRFLVGFNDKGLVAFASSYGGARKYIYADVDDNAPYFWIGAGNKSSQWWEVIWSHDSERSEVDRPIALRNGETKEYLCATKPYDDNRRYVVLMDGPKSAELEHCQWFISI